MEKFNHTYKFMTPIQTFCDASFIPSTEKDPCGITRAQAIATSKFVMFISYQDNNKIKNLNIVMTIHS